MMNDPAVSKAEITRAAGKAEKSKRSEPAFSKATVMYGIFAAMGQGVPAVHQLYGKQLFLGRDIAINESKAHEEPVEVRRLSVRVGPVET